jgi:hypothetical protein
MESGVIDSIDIVIADVTAQPLAPKSPEHSQRSGEINLSASNITIVPRPASASAQPTVTPTSHFGYMGPMNVRSHSSNSLCSVGDISLPHGQTAVTRDVKETKETKEYNDEQIIIEALRSSKDRLFMLKLGDSMESLIAERPYVSD